MIKTLIMLVALFEVASFSSTITPWRVYV